MASKHQLPPLPYGFADLEPYMDRQTVEIHYSRHHQAYVDGLNKAEEKLAAARHAADYGLIKHWERELAFHGSGNILHTLYWQNMRPGGGGRPSGALFDAISGEFGTFDTFVEQFTAAAVAVEGSGWAMLVRVPDAGSKQGRLAVLQIEKHQDLALWGAVPLLAVDVWEHAYYLKYQNRRAEFVKNWWNLVNWEDVEGRFHHISG